METTGGAWSSLLSRLRLRALLRVVNVLVVFMVVCLRGRHFGAR